MAGMMVEVEVGAVVVAVHKVDTADIGRTMRDTKLVAVAVAAHTADTVETSMETMRETTRPETKQPGVGCSCDAAED